MFCPTCKDEFRAGFTRCASCGTELVEDLSQVKEAPAEPARPPADGPVRVADYCGFFTLDEARASRDILRGKGIRSEIAIRDAPSAPGEPVEEEYWLRVEATLMRQAAALLDEAAPEPDDADAALCGSCAKEVPDDADACPHCGEPLDA